MGKTGKLVVMSGPSGTGKSSIAHEVVRRTGARFSVSVTTRKPRESELDGREYHFVDRAAFQRMIDAGELLEYAEVFEQLYGTPGGPIEEALAAGEIILLDIDVQGGAQVKTKMPDATFVLIIPPDGGELVRRLHGRGSENDDELERRLRQADAEIATATESKAYNHVIVNDDLERAIRQLIEIVEE